MANTHDAQYIFNTYKTRVEPRLEEIETWLADGWTFTQIANELGITNSLLWAMRQGKTFPRLREIFKMKSAYIDNIDWSLYRKAVGYFVEEDKPIKIKKEYYNSKNKKCFQEDVKVVKVKRYIEPDTQAIKFLLINKRGDEYHAETQKPIDNSMDLMLERAHEIVISVKDKADEVDKETEDGDK